MNFKPGGTFYDEFVVFSPSTGATLNGDATPVLTVAHNGTTDSAFTLTITNPSTGLYRVTGTVPTGYANGDVFAISYTVTIGGVACQYVLDTYQVGTLTIADVPAAVWGAVAASFATVGTLGFQFRQLFATLHGDFVATYPDATHVDATFLDTDNATTIVTSLTTLDTTGRPISRSVT